MTLVSCFGSFLVIYRTTWLKPFHKIDWRIEVRCKILYLAIVLDGRNWKLLFQLFISNCLNKFIKKVLRILTRLLSLHLLESTCNNKKGESHLASSASIQKQPNKWIWHSSLIHHNYKGQETITLQNATYSSIECHDFPFFCFSCLVGPESHESLWITYSTKRLWRTRFELHSMQQKNCCIRLCLSCFDKEIL